MLTALTDERFGRAPLPSGRPEQEDPSRAAFKPFFDMISNWMLFRDPPRHEELRVPVARAFTSRAVDRLQPRLTAIADELLDAAAPRGGMDLVADFAHPLPALAIAELLGAALEDRDRIRGWSKALAAAIDARPSPDVLQRANATTLEVQQYFGGIFEQRRRAPRQDLISALVAPPDGSPALSDHELSSTFTLLMMAGHETTTSLIANSVLALLRHPAQLERLKREPALLESAVEELLRYESPVQSTARVVRADLELGGKLLRRGQRLDAVVASANRDPAVFAEPDRLDIARDASRHLALGHGIHYCLGGTLARLECRIALSRLLERFPGLRLADERVQWRDNVILRGLARLRVEFA